MTCAVAYPTARTVPGLSGSRVSAVFTAGASCGHTVEMSAADAWVTTHYEMHGGEIFGLAFRLLRDRQLAEEVTQDTFVKAWRARDSFDGTKGSARTWLFAIARNAVIDKARARNVRFQVGPAQESLPEVPAEVGEIDALISKHWLEEALRRLEDDLRVPIVEVHIKGRPLGDVARDMGIPEGTVKSRLHRGLKKLRTMLGEVTP